MAKQIAGSSMVMVALVLNGTPHSGFAAEGNRRDGGALKSTVSDHALLRAITTRAMTADGRMAPF